VPIRIAVLLLIAVVVAAERVECLDSRFDLLQVRCDGTLTKVSSKEPGQIIGKKWLGDVQRGMLFGSYFYAIDSERRDQLLVTNLLTMKSDRLGLQFPPGKPYCAWSVDFADEKRIIISAYQSDGTPIGKRRLYYPFELNRPSGMISKLSIPDYGSTLSVYDKSIYYSNIDGHICIFDDIHGSRMTGLEGHTPTVSPDGSKLAFISFGLLMDQVNVYVFQTNRVHSLIKFFGPKAVMPILRWSHDGRLIAVRRQSDLFSSSLYVIDVSRGRAIDEFKESGACNWFFVDW